MHDRSGDHGASRIVIRPQARNSTIDSLLEVWRNGDVAWTLALREIQIRYKQSVIGVSWAVVQPLVTTLIFTLIFGVLVKIPTGDVPYPVFVLSGLLVWQYFSKVVVDSAGSLLKNEAIITKVFFPRLILPLVPTLSAAVELGISLLILFGLMFVYGVAPSVTVVFLPVVLLLTGLLGYGIGLLLSPLNAIYRDIGIALPFFVQIGMYLTPVIYPVDFVPEAYRWLFVVNPVATLLDSSRAMIIGSPFPSLAAYTVLLAWVAVILVLGFRVFRRLEPAIVDRI